MLPDQSKNWNHDLLMMKYMVWNRVSRVMLNSFGIFNGIHSPWRSRKDYSSCICFMKIILPNLMRQVTEVLEFLHQQQVAPAPTFVTGKHYEQFFEPHECRMVAKLFQELASEESSDLVKHYLEQWIV